MVEFTLWDIVRNLLLAARWTVGLSLVAFVGGGLLGAALLLLRSGGAWTRRAIAAYVQVFQGTPLLMQLFLAYFGMAMIGVETSAWVAAAVALSLYTAAYLTEIWHGCVLAIPRGQWEAGQSLALNHLELMRHVILPQAAASAWAPRWAFWCRSSRARPWPRSSASSS
jgi:polar amino acid transport system permease protein